MCLKYGGIPRFGSVQSLSCPTLCNPMDCRTSGLPVHCSWSLLKFMPIELVMPYNHLILCCPLLLLPSIFHSIRSFQMSQLFASGGQSLEFQFQHQSFQWIFRTDFLQDGLVGSPGSPRDYSPTPQFKSISSSAVSFLHSPTLTSIHDYRKNYSLD